MKKETMIDKIRKSPINYFSDLFIIATVLLWIVNNIYQMIIATVITISSVIISHKLGMNCYDSSMWSSIGTNVAIPLSCGGAIWMIKNSVQHALSNKSGEEAPYDFPEIHPTNENEKIKLEEKGEYQ